MRVRKHVLLSSIVLGGLAGGIIAPAAAQTQASAQPVDPQSTAQVANTTASAPVDPSEIVVTAQKRAENIQDVPIAITAIGGAHAADLALKDIQDLTAYVPSLRTATPGNAASSSISLRGVGQRDVNMHNEGAVAMFVDGAYVSFLSALAQPYYDLERIEVLKGPQGTLFGRNATGGLIHVISKRPSDQPEGYFTAQYGSYDEVRLESAVSGPLGSGVSGRASVLYNRADGYIKNRAGPDLNALDTLGVRLQLLFEPSDSFNFLLSGRTYQAFDVPGPGFDTSPYLVDSTGLVRTPNNYAEFSAYCTALTGAAPPLGSEVNGNCFASQPNPFKGSYSPNVRFGQDYYAVTGTAEWNISDDVTLTSITDYQRISLDYIADLDEVPALIFNFEVYNNKSDQISQELRLSGTTDSLKWVAGLYYLDINYDLSVNTDIFNHPGFGVRLPTDYVQHTKSSAVFAQVDWEFIPNLTLSIGGRLMHDKKTMTNTARCIANPLLVPPGICEILDTFVFPGALAFNRTFVGKIKDDSWSGRAILQYEPSEQTMIYGGVTRGTKGGGFNAGGAQFYRLSEVEFKPEVLTNYEVGMKTSLLDRRLTLDTSLFYYDYKDYQTVSFGSAGALRILNVDAKIKGAEVALSARPTEGLSLSLAGLYLDTEQKDVPLGTGEFRDFQVPDAPKWSLNGEIRYEFPILDGDNLALQLNGVYVGERSISAIDYPDQRLDSFVRLDARVTFTTADDHWKAAAFANNFTDETIHSTRVDFTTVTGGSVDALERPRWFGASITYSY